MKRPATLILAISSLLLFSGCAGISATKQEQMQYQSQTERGLLSRIVHDFTRNPCVFGGSDREANNHCMEASWSAEEFLFLVNQSVVDSLGEHDDCQVHTARVLQRLAESRGYQAEPIYSCPDNAPKGVCHTSVLVTHAASNKQYVLDNGSVLSAASTGGVGSYRQFVAALNGADHWTGSPDRNVLAFSRR